ncbi:MAG: hypothetical protein H0W40_01195 [Methylibium sp.]|uniref:hypothetical protein n=1 Tax=Methylibium sp. TaxID=2067992 RepID=UPI00178DC0ED|nr:hypothetical protein [Methylibium sp.]MBA3595989.1 hypothetical protein [Methylibium sp.]
MQTGTVTAEFFSTEPDLDLIFGFLEGEGYFFTGSPGAQTASVTLPGQRAGNDARRSGEVAQRLPDHVRHAAQHAQAGRGQRILEDIDRLHDGGTDVARTRYPVQ